LKKIAVITPVYNGEKFLEECINSVASSVTNNNFLIEHVIVDDGSTDNSWNTIQNLKLSSTKTFRLKINSGSSKARNYGIKHTNADYLFCLDVDDVIFQNTLRTLFETCEKQKIKWVCGDFLRTSADLSYLLGQDYYGHQFSNVAQLLNSIFLGEHFFQNNCLYCKQLFDLVGGFDENIRLAEDLDLFIRFALAGYTPKYLPAPLYLHRFHENNVSKVLGRENNLLAHRKDLKKLYKKYQVSLNTILAPQTLDIINTIC
jgi:glycosyltransferase involved in cell wall biosynthesis